MLDHQHGAPHVDVKRPVPYIGVHVFDGHVARHLAHTGVGRIIVENIDGAKAFDRTGKQCGNTVDITEIDGAGHGLAAGIHHRLGNTASAFRIGVGDHHFCALRTEPQCGRPADGFHITGTRHNGHFSFQSFHGFYPLIMVIDNV